MDLLEKLLTGAWGANLALVLALNPHDLRHGLCVLFLYTAVFFLFLAPVHVLLMGAAWSLQRRPSPAAAARRLLCAESLAFWALYWGTMFQLVPLHLRV